MAYKIKHKSHNECLIEYIEDNPSHEKSGVSLTMIVLGIGAVLIGVDFIVVICVIIMMAFWKNLMRPARRGFLIELNRQKNMIAIKNTKQANLKSTILPLEHFLGFGFRDYQVPKKSKRQPYANLFFNFDDGVLGSSLAQKSEVLELAKKIDDGHGGHIWPIPVRETAHPAPVKNAQKIIAATDAWLKLEDNHSSIEADFEIEEPPKEPEIIRDFRDME